MSSSLIDALPTLLALSTEMPCDTDCSPDSSESELEDEPPLPSSLLDEELSYF